MHAISPPVFEVKVTELFDSAENLRAGDIAVVLYWHGEGLNCGMMGPLEVLRDLYHTIRRQRAVDHDLACRVMQAHNRLADELATNHVNAEWWKGAKYPHE